MIEDLVPPEEMKELQTIAGLLSLTDRLCLLDPKTILKLAESQAQSYKNMTVVTGQRQIVNVSLRISKILAILAYTIEELQLLNPTKEELEANIEQLLTMLPGGGELKTKFREYVKELDSEIDEKQTSTS